MKTSLVLFITFAALIAWSGPASACVTCQGGDVALPTTMSEASDAQRLLTFVLELRYQSLTLGEVNKDQRLVNDHRMLISTSYRPIDALEIGAQLPLVWRDVTLVSLARHHALSLGDVTLSAQWSALDLASAHGLGIVLGLRLPTSPQVESDGVPLDLDAQPGTGAFLPFVGVNYDYKFSPVQLLARSSAFIGTPGRWSFQPGHVLLSTVGIRYTPWDPFTIGLGFDTRYETQDVAGDTLDPDSGGFIAFVSPTLQWRPAAWTMLDFTTRFPTINALNGYQTEGVVWSISLGFFLDVDEDAPAARPAIVAAPPSHDVKL